MYQDALCNEATRAPGPVRGQTAVAGRKAGDSKADSDLLQPSHEALLSQWLPDSERDDSRISTGRVICHKTNCYKSAGQI